MTGQTYPPIFRRFQFFQEHAGYIEGERAKCAIDLARAEQWAEDCDLVFEWEWDTDLWSLGDHKCWCADARLEIDHSHEITQCIVRSIDGRNIATVGGVIDADSTYRRVVEAELASELKHEIEEIAYASL